MKMLGSTAGTSPATVERIIRPKHGLVAIDFRELWRYRELFGFLAWRDILVRYKQTAIGIAWAVIQPILTMVVFTVIFGRLAKLPSSGAPYPVMIFAALLPWQFFANALSQSSSSLIGSANIISKVYFPRLIIPVSSTISGAVDFLISFIILIGLMIWYGVSFRVHLLLLPLFFLVSFFAALAVGLWLSALNVKYRDVRYVVPFLVQVGLYVSPVGFISGIVPGKWRFWYTLNPMVGVIDGFRWTILGQNFQPYWLGFWASLAILLLFLVFGAYYFRFTEKMFADII
jgi:lipopolysaccharide transport system permease protein